MSEAATATHNVRPDSVLRYTFQERVMHWATALAYSYCLATGLAFYTPYLFWMAVILGGRLRNATVTWCHRHTRDLASICREADLLIPCAGADLGDRKFLITADMVKPGACVIDVGFRRIGPGRFGGDVDFAAVSKVAKWITPNPGGTGPMTVLALMQNLIDAARYQHGLERARYSV